MNSPADLNAVALQLGRAAIRCRLGLDPAPDALRAYREAHAAACAALGRQVSASEEFAAEAAALSSGVPDNAPPLVEIPEAIARDLYFRAAIAGGVDADRAPPPVSAAKGLAEAIVASEIEERASERLTALSALRLAAGTVATPSVVRSRLALLALGVIRPEHTLGARGTVPHLVR